MRLPRVQFTLRTIMAAVVVMGLISGGYVGLIRLGPVLSEGQRKQLIVAKEAEAAYQNAKLLRDVVEISLQETIEHSARGSGDAQRERDRLDWQSRVPRGFWLPYSNRLLQAGDGSEEAAMRSEADKARANEAATKVIYERERAAEQKLAWLVKAIQLVTPPNRNQ